MSNDEPPPDRKPRLSPIPLGCALLFGLAGAHIGLVVAAMYFFTPGHGWKGPNAAQRLIVALCSLVYFTVIPAIVGALIGGILSLFWGEKEES